MLSLQKFLFKLTIALTFLKNITAQDSQFSGIPGCRTTKLDMVFALDGSNSVGNSFVKEKELGVFLVILCHPQVILCQKT